MSTRTLAYWLALVDRLVERGFAGALEEHGITRMQWRILTALGEGPASADQLDVALADLPAYDDDATAAEQLAELVESGWVEAADAYRLTERGRSAHDHILDAVAELRTRVLTDISPEEERVMIALLERMARNLGWEG
ncbi:MAG TPA: MarR family transcriptional regulator [Protaetiibacter sp.]|nr:MarR family transcriptional regulator [Protaetiibacter sp.]